MDIFEKEGRKERTENFFKMQKIYTVFAFLIMAGIIVIGIISIYVTILIVPEVEYILKWVMLGLGCIVAINIIVAMILAIVFIKKYRNKDKKD